MKQNLIELTDGDEKKISPFDFAETIIEAGKDGLQTEDFKLYSEFQYPPVFVAPNEGGRTLCKNEQDAKLRLNLSCSALFRRRKNTVRTGIPETAACTHCFT